MKIMGISISSNASLRWLFHLLFWSIWILLPLLTRAENEEFRRFYIAIMPVVLSNIPLFLLNSNWLIPKVFRQKGVGIYLLALLGLVLAFAAIQFYGKIWLIHAPDHRSHKDFFWTLTAVTFLTAVSTGYGFIVYLLEQEKVRKDEQHERLQSEVGFLRTQISPHFIFNVLNSIVYLIRTNPPLAETVTLKLSELMRYMLYDSRESQVPLHLEMGYLENYVELQKIRFEEDVEIRFSQSGDPGAELIEPLILLPFVENAFKHGVGMVADPFIDIELQIREHQLQFNVSNKIAPETALEKDSSSGIGLRNVSRRLELLYPDRHRLDISATEGIFKIRLALDLSVKPSKQ